MRKLTKRSTAVIAGTAAVVIGGGAAWATVNGWEIGGSGTAEADTASITPLTATAQINGKIFPGKVTTITTSVNNPNEFKVQLTGTLTPTGAEVIPATPACLSALPNASVLSTTFPGTPEVPAGAQGFSVNSNLTVGNIPQACAGKKIKVTYTFTSVSKA
ncbi:hypothetical protein [Actinoplanes sp. DH11]|uniref:hypothetical protein n=1 Tax=Actinoplanes sp. DH11 TaxID=2857011 RepID=UPI001E5DB693|nr:hypothetical protein [Actinoplanes sp. DH11]